MLHCSICIKPLPASPPYILVLIVHLLLGAIKIASFNVCSCICMLIQLTRGLASAKTALQADSSLHFASMLLTVGSGA